MTVRARQPVTLLSFQQRGEAVRSAAQAENSYGPDDGYAAQIGAAKGLLGPIHRCCSTNDLHRSVFALRQASVLVLRQFLLMPET